MTTRQNPRYLQDATRRLDLGSRHRIHNSIPCIICFFNQRLTVTGIIPFTKLRTPPPLLADLIRLTDFINRSIDFIFSSSDVSSFPNALSYSSARSSAKPD